ncbi:hypothetical protein [Microbispora sp. NBRC 16548]|uniref:hypothetical protein n=1 Tax=Microbispora sp. NBRC 16548 TaxID=3030994 RepID=UPI0024A1CB7D|nr:hypothetical protein [Microbispora sp. NBRC 16548]GLX06607.1 hypothetical protein Misp03_35340 [Microbispora sp. NBRC 16548]
MTPRHAAQPENSDQALVAAMHLSALLARRNIPAYVYRLPNGVVVSVFAGLLAHVDRVIWWAIPDLTGTRDKPLTTFAHTTEAAAGRLAEHYDQLRSVPLGELVGKGLITPVAAALLDDNEVHRDVVPV